MASSFEPPSPLFSSTAETTTVSSSIADIHPDILQSHILTRLDGPTLASTACATTELHSLASQEDLWTNICLSTWPSTDMPRLRQVISSFPNGPRSFFSASFPLLTVNENPATSLVSRDRPSELISAVDIYYRHELIFSRVVETKTESGWFRCSPFRIDMLDPKDTCPTQIPHPETEDDRRKLAEEFTLSWILIDSAGRRAMNLSSHKPVSVQRHWLTGEVHARFASILVGEKGSASEFVQCGILVTCGGGSERGGMHVREVSLQVEDMDGMFMNGKDSLGILNSSFEGKKGIKGRKEEEGKKRYEEFLEMKRGRKERKLRTESTLDILCVTFGVLIFASLGLFVLFR
ncbi:hypothetical protein JCGZ_08829 [Jatropha curcas]|uniref:F-box domain-containing protein n=1 Tax=Jatropha curcas TaxID=180498 RepID=A0A067KV96_JATCU|nr:probable F-box protein At2g36090 [Jatropha curcas]KDP36185.1 hypothetical protein JCGZ_08829 [Jatropha curcas]